MDANSALNRILFLRSELNRHNHLYYVENSPEISDFEFDHLMRELQDLEKEFPQFDDPNSPSVRVGSDITSSFESVRHHFPMLSLSNTYSIEELQEFVRKVEAEVGPSEFCCELKFDGTAISLTYQNGALLRAVTRGDGERGDDVTRNARTIGSIPLVLQGKGYPDFFEIRGEILMPYASFDKLNIEREQQGESLFANPRNAAAGTLKLQQSSVVRKRGLDCTLYQISGDSLPFNNHWDNLQEARRWGFKISDKMKICRSFQEIVDYINYWDQARKDLPFPTDGVVIKLNDFALRTRMGFTAKSPKWAVAYKFKAEQALTRLNSVDFQVGRTGAITPVANLDPVHLAGTVVKRATLHNAEQIALMDLRVGDMVYVEKGGEIIPKITGVELSQRDSKSEEFTFITHCPECGAELVRYEGEAKHYCPNQSHCRPQILGRFVHFIQRKAMNIDGLGEETIELLFNSGLIQNIADLYTLKAVDLAVLPRLGERSAQNIVESIRTSVNVPFHRVLFGLGIRFVGETTAKYLASHFKTLDAIMAASPEELCQSDEVGEKIAVSIIEYFQDPANQEIISRLREAGVKTEAEIVEKISSSLDGKNIVVSGKFLIRTRDQIKQLIELNGGKNQSSVASNTDFIVAGDNMGPAKLQKAEKLGVRILSEAEFLEMINDNIPQKKEVERKAPIVTQGSLF